MLLAESAFGWTASGRQPFYDISNTLAETSKHQQHSHTRIQTNTHTPNSIAFYIDLPAACSGYDLYKLHLDIHNHFHRGYAFSPRTLESKPIVSKPTPEHFDLPAACCTSTYDLHELHVDIHNHVYHRGYAFSVAHSNPN